MRRHYVSSSVIRWHGYDPGTRALEIEFTSGHLYRYSAVPPDIAAALQAADSKGRYFDLNIRKRFATQRLR